MLLYGLDVLDHISNEQETITTKGLELLRKITTAPGANVHDKQPARDKDACCHREQVPVAR